MLLFKMQSMAIKLHKTISFLAYGCWHLGITPHTMVKSVTWLVKRIHHCTREMSTIWIDKMIMQLYNFSALPSLSTAYGIRGHHMLHFPSTCLSLENLLTHMRTTTCLTLIVSRWSFACGSSSQSGSVFYRAQGTPRHAISYLLMQTISLTYL